MITLQLEHGKPRHEMTDAELLPIVNRVVQSVCERYPRLTPSCEPHIDDWLRKLAHTEVGLCSVYTDYDFNRNTVSVTVKVQRTGWDGQLPKSGIKVIYKWLQ